MCYNHLLETFRGAMRNYICGSSGFIGTHLKQQLTDVVCIPHEKISKIKLKPFDNFFFLSSYGNLAGQTDEKEILKANVLDLISIIKQAIKFPFNSFVYFSSSSVKLPIQTMYSRCKRASEEILLAFIEKYHLPICIIRPYSVTGVGEQPQHLIPTLIRAAIKNEEITLSSGTHDFIDVSDVCSGVLNLTKQGARGIYELGTGIKTTNEEVLALVEKVIGKKLKVKRVPQLRKYDNPDWVCNNFKARMFGWLPVKSLEQSIKDQYDTISKTSN